MCDKCGKGHRAAACKSPGTQQSTPQGQRTPSPRPVVGAQDRKSASLTLLGWLGLPHVASRGAGCRGISALKVVTAVDLCGLTAGLHRSWPALEAANTAATPCSSRMSGRRRRTRESKKKIMRPTDYRSL